MRMAHPLSAPMGGFLEDLQAAAQKSVSQGLVALRDTTVATLASETLQNQMVQAALEKQAKEAAIQKTAEGLQASLEQAQAFYDRNKKLVYLGLAGVGVGIFSIAYLRRRK